LSKLDLKNIISYSVFVAVVCVLFGIFTSVSICAGYHIFLLVPGVVCFFWSVRQDGLKALPASGWALLLLVLLGVISCAVNWDTMQRPVRGLFKLKYFLFGVLGLVALRYVFNRGVPRKVIRGLLHLFFASIIISVAYGLAATFANFDLITWQKGSFPRIGGLTHTMRFACGLSMVLPVLLTLWLRRREWGDWFNVRLLQLTLMVGLVGLSLTQTRGALVGLICSLVLVISIWCPKAGYLAGGVYGVCICLLAVGNYYTNEKGDYLGSFLRGPGNLTSRLSQYNAVLYGIQERPVLGFGMGGYPQHVPRIKRQHGLREYPGDTAHSHNTFLEVGANLGIPSLMVFLAWICLWVRENQWQLSACPHLF
jgi:O-antigen ligase